MQRQENEGPDPSVQRPSPASETPANSALEPEKASALEAEALFPTPVDPPRELSESELARLARHLLCQGPAAVPSEPDPDPVRTDSLLGPFESQLRMQEPTEAHVEDLMRRLRKVLEVGRLVTLRDFTERRVNDAIVHIWATTPGRYGHKNIGKRTVNQYIQAAKQFTAWLDKKAKLLQPDPLSGLDKLSMKDADLRVVRRAITPQQFDKLIETAFYGKTIESVPGPDRAFLYLVAANTGFRKAELGGMTPESFDLVNCRLTIRPSCSKRRKLDTQLFARSVATDLVAWLRTKPAGKLLWVISDVHEETKQLGGKDRKTHKMIRLDCEACGIPYKTRDGKCDFHALRHTYVTNLASDPKVSIFQLQAMARHSDIALTRKYARAAGREEEKAAEAVNQLPSTTFRPGAHLQ